jgi:periplasmic protein TonB
MSKIDLTSLEWRELVFQGKNKQYGAYQLRGESNKRHNRAMLIVTIVALIGFSMPKLIELATPKQKEVNETVTTLSQLEKATVKNDIKKATEVAPPPPLKSTIRFVAPVIAKDEDVKEEDQMKSQEELTNSNVAISVADVKGVTGGTVDIADVKAAVTEVEPEKIWDVIEQMPSFPGGDGELMATLSKNIKYPVIAQENGIQGKVILGFVVTKTGAISDVTVLRSLDPSCDKEAIRVVKLLPKWIPGKQNGENVNVRYTLPVVFKLQE